MPRVITTLVLVHPEVAQEPLFEDRLQPAHPQAARPPPHGAEGTHGRGEGESYSYSYTPSSEESEEERSEPHACKDSRELRCHLYVLQDGDSIQDVFLLSTVL